MFVILKRIGLCCGALAAALASGYHFTRLAWMRLTAIPLWLYFYHCYMRLFVSNVCNALMHNHADYNKRWYQVADWEMRLYKKMGIRHWKDKMPTYDPSTFDSKKHTKDEIAQTMCQSERVHEANAVLSFVPLLLIHWTGGFWLSLTVSVCTALVDLMLVAMQRYNRCRIVRILNHKARISGTKKA